MSKTLLFLDDNRDPHQYKTKKFLPPTSYRDIVWVKNYTQFVLYVEIKGLPDIISFDHDLGNKRKSGKDAANFLVEYCMDTGLPLPEFYAHTANPVGEKNIMELLINFKEKR